MTPVIIHPQAFLEIEGAKKWYESQSQGLGGQFMNELDRGMEYTREYPKSWPVYVSGTRRYLLHRFPFPIVYSYDGKEKRSSSRRRESVRNEDANPNDLAHWR